MTRFTLVVAGAIVAFAFGPPTVTAQDGRQDRKDVRQDTRHPPGSTRPLAGQPRRSPGSP